MNPIMVVTLMVAGIAIVISFFVAGLIKLMLYVMHFNKKRLKKNLG